jgi:hypothetical protein
VIRYEQYGNNSSRMVKRYEKYGRKVSWIVKRYEKYGRKVSCKWKDMGNTEEGKVE